MNRFEKILYFFFLSFFFTFSAYSQQKIVLDHYTIEDGLPVREISQVVKDSNGFIWVGTSSGISRFDGYDFVNFNTENTKAITDDRITALLVVQDVLWVGTQSNLLLFNLKTQAWQEYPNIGAIVRLFKDSKNQIWLVANQDEVYCILNNGTLKKIEASQPPATWVRATVNAVQTIDEGEEGVWWGRLDGTLRQYSEKNEKVNLIFDGNKYEKRGNVFLDKDTLIWHSTNDYLILYHINGQEIPIEHDVKNLTRAGTTTELPNGSVLLTDLENRILELNSVNRNTVFYEELSNQLSVTRAINSVFADNNLLWLATNSGLYKVDFKASQFNKILDYDNGLNSIRCIVEFENNEMLVSAYTGLHFMNKKNEVERIIKKPLYIFYELIPKTDNTYWVASEGTGLLEFNAKDKSIKHLTYNYDTGGNPARYLTSLEETDSLLYIGEYTGLYAYHKSIGRMENVKNQYGELILAGVRINDLHIDNNGVLWIASNDGVYTLDIASGTSKRRDFEVTGGNSYEARVIFETSDHKIWFGTRRHGLLMLDKQRQQEKQWKKIDGLAFDAVNTIIATNNEQYLWISTDFGLSQFDRSTSTFNNYYEKDGVSNNEFNRNAALKHSNGSIYMGGINGVSIYNPAQLTKEIENAKMMLTGFSKYDGNQGQVLHQKNQVINQREFVIAPEDRLFSFQFALENYYDVAKNQFRYKIEPIQENWVSLGSQHELLVDNLDAGNYVLRIQGTSGEGQWSNHELLIHLTIEQVYYKTIWFLFLVALAIVFITWVAHKMRVRQLLKIERMRTRIARDLHDELGSSLTRISMYSDLAKIKGEGKNNLEQLSDLSKEAASTLSDIVWSIDNENDTLEELIGRMKDHLMIMVKPTSIQWDFKVEGLKQQIVVNAEAKQNLFLIYKEAINNVLKHALASFIHVMICRNINDLELSIENDGASHSIKNNEPGKGGKGTKSMQTRTEALKGNYIVQKNDATYRVLITIPLKSL